LPCACKGHWLTHAAACIFEQLQPTQASLYQNFLLVFLKLKDFELIKQHESVCYEITAQLTSFVTKGGGAEYGSAASNMALMLFSIELHFSTI
jgi:hypothetical protein